MNGWTRRAVLASTGAMALPARTAATPTAPRVVALDWTLGAITIDLGIAPVGFAEQASYADWVRAPAIPPRVAEIGLRTAPSFETLAALKPDLILINGLHERIRPQLESIAPTFTNTIYTDERRPLWRAALATRELGQRLGVRRQAEALTAEAEARIAAARTRIGGGWPQPLLPLIFLDGRHAGFFGAGSLYAAVLEALGLRSGLTLPTSAWGQVTCGIDALGDCPPADVLVIAPIPAAVRPQLERRGLWSSLLAAKHRRAFMLPQAWAFGDCGAGARFADLVADALLGRSPPA